MTLHCILSVSMLLTLTSTARAADLGWLVQARAGGGWLANVDAADTLSAGRDGWTWSAGSSAGAWWAPGRSHVLLDIDYDTQQLPAYPALSQHAVQGSLRLRHPLAWHLDASVSPFLAGRLAGEADRDALDLGATAGLDWRCLPWLASSLGYRFLHRDARQEVYDRDAHRLALTAEARLATRTWLDLGLAGERGEYVTYSASDADPATGAVSIRRSRRGGDGRAERPSDAPSAATEAFEDPLIAWSSMGWSASAQLGLSQGLGDHLSLRASSAFARVWAADVGWPDLSAQLDLGIFLP